MNFYSELSDRKLRYDGVSEVEPDRLARFLLLEVPPNKLRVTEETEEIRQYNAQVPDHEQLKLVGPEPVQLNLEWQLPERYTNLDLDEYFAALYDKAQERYTLDQQVQVLDRIVTELHEVRTRKMEQFIRAVIYIIDEFRAHDVVWGVGRGSSCASYLLFLVGLHVVDCVMMEVPMQEFFHE